MTETTLHGEIFIQHIVWGLQYMLVPILCLEYKEVTICAVKMSRGDRIDGIISLFGRSKCRIRVIWPTEPCRNQPNLWYYFLIWNIQMPNPSDMTDRTIWKSVVTAVNWFNPFFFHFSMVRWAWILFQSVYPRVGMLFYPTVMPERVRPIPSNILKGTIADLIHFYIFQWSDGPEYYFNRNIPESACQAAREWPIHPK